MWAIEAKTFDEDPNYFRMYGLTAAEARRMHSEMANSGEWPFVRSWDADAEATQKEADTRIKDYFQSLEDGIGEGQPR
jgi:hypothetical protein